MNSKIINNTIQSFRACREIGLIILQIVLDKLELTDELIDLMPKENNKPKSFRACQEIDLVTSQTVLDRLELTLFFYPFIFLSIYLFLFRIELIQIQSDIKIRIINY